MVNDGGSIFQGPLKSKSYETYFLGGFPLEGLKLFQLSAGPLLAPLWGRGGGKSREPGEKG